MFKVVSPVLVFLPTRLAIVPIALRQPERRPPLVGFYAPSTVYSARHRHRFHIDTKVSAWNPHADWIAPHVHSEDTEKRRPSVITFPDGGELRTKQAAGGRRPSARKSSIIPAIRR